MRALVVALFLLATAVAQEPSGTDALPVKKIILYKSGVGYFEHLGSVRDNQQVSVPFTSSQLDDVLKSLTVLDLNGGRVSGINYSSSAPVDRQLGDLRLTPTEKPSLTEFLGALRGARVEVRNGAATATGRLLSVERKTRVSGGISLEVDYISLVTEGGEVRTTEISPTFSVRLLEKGLPAKVDRFLNLASSSREPDVRRMVISAEGTGPRSLFVSYLSEVPVWKSTYRIVLTSKTPATSLLQGWAIVDNTLGQDWEKVELSLMSGAPQSFVQKISQPYYVRRPEVPLPGTASFAPQTHQATLLQGGARLSGTVTDPTGSGIAGARVRVFTASGEFAGEATANAQGVYEMAGLPDGPMRVEAGSPGFSTAVIPNVYLSAAVAAKRDVRLTLGQVSETVQVEAQATTLETASASSSQSSGRSLGSGRGLGGNAAAPPPPPRAQGFSADALSRIASARAGLASSASAAALGDLLEYRITQPMTIRRNESALVPIIQSNVGCERISVWNPTRGLPRPQRSVWLTNSTGLTLDGGSFSVIDDESFAGEGITEPVRPGEKRLLSYALDLGLTVGADDAAQPQRITHVRVVKGVLTQRSEMVEKRTYTLRNEDTSSRIVLIEHPVRGGYELRGTTKPIETTAGWMRFRVSVDPKQTATLVVDEARPVEVRYALAEITKPMTALFVQQRSINQTIEDALTTILQKRAAVEALETRKSALDDENEKIFDDQQRLRENMKALKGSAEEKSLVQRYAQQLSAQETRLDQIRKDTEGVDARLEAAKADLAQFISALDVDTDL